MPRYGYRRRPTFRLRRRFRQNRNPSKKYSPRKWRRHLLGDTHSNTHYRSLWTQRVTPVAPADPNEGSFSKYTALPESTVQKFWVTPAAKSADTGDPVPGFGRNIVIRGGRITLSVGLRPGLLAASEETIKVVIFLIWRKPCSDNAILPSSTTDSWTWDPSVVPDFTRYGRVVRKWQAILEPKTGSSSVQVFHPLKPQKIDHENFEQKGSQFEWVVGLNKISFNTAGTHTVYVNFGHSLSFSGDEIS